MSVSQGIFTADPENLDFPTNREAKIAVIRKATVRLMLGGVGLAVLSPTVLAIVSLLRLGRIPLGFSTFVVLSTAMCILAEVVAYNAWRRNKHLYSEGEVLPGSIVSSSGQPKTTHYEVTIHYRFMTPEGEERTGKFTFIRNDLKDQPLPPPGTPVRVVYRNPRHHRVL